MAVQDAIHRLHVFPLHSGGKKIRMLVGSAMAVLSGGRERMQPKDSSSLAQATAMVRLGTIAGRMVTTGLRRSTLHAMLAT
jgi:hypothetical protein